MSMKCCQYTIKVTEGNEWDLLLQLKTGTYEADKLITEDVEFINLHDVVVTIDGHPWPFTIEQNGVQLHIPADMPLGPHDVELTAMYNGAAIRAAYYECFTIVKWSYDSNIGNYIPESPQASELAYVYVGITDDEELEALKQQYREAIAAIETARLQYEAAKEEFNEKAEGIEALNDVAQQSTSLQIKDKLDNLSVDSEDARMVAQFFGLPAALPDGYEFMTPEEVCSELEDIMTSMDITLTQQQAQEITQQTLTQQ